MHAHPETAFRRYGLAARQDKIELFYLPIDRPELNPEERLDADLKQAIGKKVPVRTNDQLKLLPPSTWPSSKNHPSGPKNWSSINVSNMKVENSNFSWPDQQARGLTGPH